MLIKIDNTGDFKVEEPESTNNYPPDDDITRAIYLAIKKLTKLENTHFFKSGSIFMTDSFNTDIIDTLDTNRICFLYNQYGVKTNIPITKNNFINNMINSFEPISYSFNSFLLIAELEDNIYKIENNKTLNLQ